MDFGYLGKKMDTLGIAKESNGLIKRDKISIEDVAAYRIYEAAINEGRYVVQKGMGMKELLKRNGVVALNDLSIESINEALLAAGRLIILLDSEAEKGLEALTTSFTELGALLLLLQVVGLSEVFSV